MSQNPLSSMCSGVHLILDLLKFIFISMCHNTGISVHRYYKCPV